ncbi:MAG: DUF4397 domain-containing protein [Ginsengibacter sp.]
MKKIFFSLRRHTVPLAGFLLVSLLFGACKKTLETGSQPPVAGLMAFNLMPDQESIGFTLSGNNLVNFPLQYTNYTGSYLGIYVGSRDVASYDANSRATLATASQLFADSAYYSVFALGTNGHYRNVIVKDNLDSLSSTTGQAFVRYVNGITDSTALPLVTISSNGTDVFNTNAPFSSVSDFKGITPGNVSVKVNNESAINATRTITLEQGKIYTVLFVGTPGQTDTSKAVQIKFIQNGTVSANP